MGGALRSRASAIVSGAPTGVAADACSIAALSNSGQILGANGANSSSAHGGVGVSAAVGLTIGSITNKGGATISGGAGGAALLGGPGGADIANSGAITKLTNGGTISGGAGGIGVFGSGAAGVGLLNAAGGTIGGLSNFAGGVITSVDNLGAIGGAATVLPGPL